VYKQLFIKSKSRIGKKGQKRELTGRRILRRGRSALDCRTIQEKEEKEEEEEGGGGVETVTAIQSKCTRKTNEFHFATT
jgi:hypothetical protein